MMDGSTPAQWISRHDQDGWLGAIDRAILAAEAAELELSRHGGNDPSQQRKASGSYYTPSDVAGHFWDLFFRLHRIRDLRSLLAFVATSELVEPSAGSGMFVFSFLRKAAQLGATPESLAGVRFHVVDINLAALRFFSERLREVEDAAGVRFDDIRLVQSDFLAWAKTGTTTNVVFAGSAPEIDVLSGTPRKTLFYQVLAKNSPKWRRQQVRRISPLRDRFRACWRRGQCSAAPA